MSASKRGWGWLDLNRLYSSYGLTKSIQTGLRLVNELEYLEKINGREDADEES